MKPLFDSAGRIFAHAAVKISAVLLFFTLWELAPTVGWVDRALLPPFSDAVRALIRLAGNGVLWEHLTASLKRAGAGFGITVLLAIPIGVCIGRFRKLERFLDPLLQLFRQIPAIALISVFILLFGLGETSKIVMIVYGSFWGLLLNTVSGVKNTDLLLIKAAKSMGISGPGLLIRVVLPGAVPYIMSGLRLCATSSLLMLIGSEMLGASSGLGYYIQYSQQIFKTADMYAVLLVIAGLGLSLNAMLLLLEKKLYFWNPGDLER